MIGRTATGLTITPLGYPTHKAHNWMICARPQPSRPGCLTHRVGDPDARAPEYHSRYVIAAE